MRLTSRCTRARKLPTSMEATERKATTIDHLWEFGAVPPWTTASRSRKSTRALATLGATERKATNGDGAPWYVSGDQAWKGAMLILKPKAATRNRKPRLASTLVNGWAARAWPTPKKRVLTVAP